MAGAEQEAVPPVHWPVHLRGRLHPVAGAPRHTASPAASPPTAAPTLPLMRNHVGPLGPTDHQDRPLVLHLDLLTLQSPSATRVQDPQTGTWASSGAISSLAHGGSLLTEALCSGRPEEMPTDPRPFLRAP